MNDTTKKLDDFGEVIHGAKKHNFADLDLTNADTRKLPFSKLWAKSEIDAIEDVTVAAIAHHIRSSLPAKPRKPLAQKNWFTKLENAQTTVAWLVARPESAKTLIEKLEAGGWNDRAGAFAIQMMAQTDRKHWDKMAFDVRLSQFIIQIGNENHRYNVADVGNANIADVVTAMKPAIAEALSNFQEAPSKQKELQFSVYRNTATNEIFIAVKSDKHKTPLINFDTVAEARNYLHNEDTDIRRENVENLYQLWQGHKELNNIVKADMRSAENTARTGIGYRDGRDITPEEFLQTFNVRGGQFGNWVKGDERQIHLNHAYDAFMDLSKAANIPPSAIGLNGELGIAFGARGSGWAAAHYETQHKVINLTKTKGAGSLAHEWWHALDHYLGGKDLATRDISTIRPENMRHAELSTALQSLLKVTSNTGLQQRSIKADSYRSKAYFGTKVEMTARAFEKYVANKLEGHGIRNDYLVNIIKFSDWQRNSDAYVYPKDDELEAFSQAYDHVFDKLVEVDKSFQREAKAAEQEQELQSNPADKNAEKQVDATSETAPTAQAESIQTADQAPEFGQRRIKPIFNQWTLNDVLQFKGYEWFDNPIKEGALQLPLESVLAHGIDDTPNSQLFMNYFSNLRLRTRDLVSPMHQTEMFMQNDAYFEERESRINQVQASLDAIVQKYGNQVIDQAAVFSVDENNNLSSSSINGTAAFGALELKNNLQYEYSMLAKDRELANYYHQIPFNPTDATKPLTKDASNQQYNELLRQQAASGRFDHDYQQKFESYVQNAKLFIERPVASQAAFGNRMSVVENLRNEILTHLEIVKEQMAEAEKELPPQHPVKIPADDKGSKLGSSKSDEYLQKIADRILEQVKNNEAPWQKPFEAGAIHNVLPVSGASGKTYQGLNLINLMATAAAKGYDDNRWFTYNNAQEAGGQVRRGEKGTQIHFWHIPTKEDVEKEQTKAAAEGREPKNLSPKLRIYTVFNAEQIDGLPERQLNETLLTKFERHEKAESILKNSGVRIEHSPEKTGYYSAHYSSRTDTITLPQRELFVSADAYYATALHELAHATGHESRLNRDLSGAFGSYSYAKEELRAEMASMMIGQELQLGHDPSNHYAYLQSWAAVIENDPKEFFKAAKDADLITNYVLNLDKTKEKVAEVERAAERTAEAVKQPTSSYNAIPHRVHEVAKLDKPLEEKVLLLAEKSGIADKIQSIDRQQLLSFVRGIKTAMDFNERNHEQLLNLATYSNKKFDAREFAMHTGMVSGQGAVAYDKALHDLADAGILKSLDDGWKYELTDEAAYLIKQTYNVVEAEKTAQQEIPASITKLEPTSEFGQQQSDFEKQLQSINLPEGVNYIYERLNEDVEIARLYVGEWRDDKLIGEQAFIDKNAKFTGYIAKYGENEAQIYNNLQFAVDVVGNQLAKDYAADIAEYKRQQAIQSAPIAPQGNITAENRRLFVPYEQKDVASALGARWDKDNKTWYAPAGSDLDKFKPWLKEPVREFARPEDEFARQLEAHGLRLESGHPIMDGQWHRLKVDGDRTGKSGAYIGHLDGVPRGTVKNFKTGQETNWTAKDAVVKSVPSSLDIERAKAAAEAKQKASYNQAADAAKLVLNHAQPAQNHPYLDKKDVAAHGLYIVPDKSAVNLDNTNLAIANDWREAKAMRESFKADGIEKQVLTKGDLIVPAINEHGDLRTFQMISGNDGSFKSFVKGGEKSGSYHVIGDLNNAKDVIIAEGYATAATLHENTAKPVVVAFDAGNLSTVAEKVRATLPDVRIYIAADNDRNNAVNTGIEKANLAAEKVDAKVIVPKFDKLDGAEKLSDWNDLHKANPHDFKAQLATSEMGRQDFADKLANLSPEHQEVFKGWYDYINDKLANLPEVRNAKQASLEQEILKAEQGNSNLPSVADYQAQQNAKKQAAQVVIQQPTQQATITIQPPTVDIKEKGKNQLDARLA